MNRRELILGSGAVGCSSLLPSIANAEEDMSEETLQEYWAYHRNVNDITKVAIDSFKLFQYGPAEPGDNYFLENLENYVNREFHRWAFHDRISYNFIITDYLDGIITLRPINKQPFERVRRRISADGYRDI